ncbi:MAG: ABC transporter substrate-binding protein [Hydrogenophaga sp.]|jgi:NitT/TauT family transport system substrate-binding protein
MKHGASPSRAGERGRGDLQGGWLHRGWRTLAATALLALSACGEPVVPPLTVGMNPWVGYDPLVLARDRGLTDAQQLRVVELASASETLRHLRNGLLDAATLTLDETLRLAESGVAVRIVAVLDESTGGDAVLAAPRITSPAQLKGEFIAVEDSAVGALLLQRTLQKAGLTRADVKVTNIEVARHLEALQSGQAAAAVSYEPLAGAIEAAGFRRIFDSSELPGEILDVLVVRAEVLEQRPEAVDALLRAWYAGLDLFKRDLPGAAELLARGTDLSPAAYQAVLGGLAFQSRDASARELQGDPPPLVKKASTVSDALQSIGLLLRTPRWQDLIDGAPMERLQAGGTVP